MGGMDRLELKDIVYERRSTGYTNGDGGRTYIARKEYLFILYWLFLNHRTMGTYSIIGLTNIIRVIESGFPEHVYILRVGELKDHRHCVL